MRTLIALLVFVAAAHAEVAENCCVEGTGSEWAKAPGAHQPPCLLDNRCLKHSDLSSTPPTRCESMTDGVRHGWIVYPGPDGSTPYCAWGGAPHPAVVTRKTVEDRKPLVEEAVLAAVRRNTAGGTVDQSKLQAELASSMETLKKQCGGTAATGDEDDAIGRQSPDCAAAIRNLDQIITPLTSGEPGAAEKATRDLEARVAARNPGAASAPATGSTGDPPAANVDDANKCGVPVECQSFPDKPGKHLWHFHASGSIVSVRGWPKHCGGRDLWQDGPCGEKPANPDAAGACGVPDGCQNADDGSHFYHEHKGGARYVAGSFTNCGGDSPRENGPCDRVGAPRPPPPAPAPAGGGVIGTGTIDPPSGLNPNVVIGQPNDWTCSATSLAISLAQFGMKPANVNTVNEVVATLGSSIDSDVGLKGDARALVPAAQRFGLKTSTGGGSSAEVAAELAKGRVVCLNVTTFPQGHFVNVSAYADGVFTIQDPARGTTKKWTAAELDRWNKGSHMAVWP